jgi:GT2 family glycosyltransferase
MIQYNAEHLCRPGEFIHYDRAKLSFHSTARDNLVSSMRGDWLLMLDCDHTFEPDILHRLLHRMTTHNVDVVTAVYTFKGGLHSPVLFTGDDNQPIGNWEDGVDLIPCDSAGAGTLLVRRSVFDRIQTELKESPFAIEYPFGEDHSFFRRLRKLGIKAYFDPRIESHHLVTRRLSLADYDRKGAVVGERQKVIGQKIEA